MSDWIVDGMSPEAVLSWARQMAADASTTSVIVTRGSEDGPVTMDGRATLLHCDVTAVGTFTVVLWADRPDRPGGDYVVRRHPPGYVPPWFPEPGSERRVIERETEP